MTAVWLLAAGGLVLAGGGLWWSLPYPRGTRRYNIGTGIALVGVLLLWGALVFITAALLSDDPYPPEPQTTQP